MSTTAGSTQSRTISDRIINGSTLDAVIYADHTGEIRLWNDAATHMFGWTSEEAVGQSLDIIIPERQRNAHWTGWDRVMETGETRYGLEPLTAPGTTKDGSRISLEFSIVMLKDIDGKVEGVAAVLRDVTARWEKDRETRRRLREAEAKLAELTD
ncbi:MAG TPA: PAS domain S-box protein [Candidatus Corynebacterium avicola]|uniref:PAS domain S-box protein n=1 Tax=Candidatus Corynebacterium avicola TaxID=2838527 RepID=A0A9D1RN16_9CORY|nr:PAS domain S-box protein [Candidatus Corynebacterium avicola]